MSFRISRLFLVKFLGLWTTGPTNISDTNLVRDDKDHLKANESIRSAKPTHELAVDQAIKSSDEKILALLLEKGIPGLTICVSKQNKILWRSAFGYCDAENLLTCQPDAQMRIASISKSLFATAIVAPLLEKGKITINTSVHKYLDDCEFPRQKYEGEEQDITVGQLMSHTSGIKHYDCYRYEDYLYRPVGSSKSKKVYQTEDQYNRIGYYQRKTFRNVIDALEPFKDSPLVAKPGEFYYTTYGYTLLSAVMQKILSSDGKTDQIEDFWLKTLRNEWGMKNTYLDQDDLIIPRRARYYLRTSFNGELVNAPYTDNSVKWAGGGLVSNCEDLVKFANSLIACYKGKDGSQLRKETVELLWKKVTKSYALGFEIKSGSADDEEEFVVLHTGSANGASSVLLIYPKSEIVVAILTNLGFINLRPLALDVANSFKNVDVTTEPSK